MQGYVVLGTRSGVRTAAATAAIACALSAAGAAGAAGPEAGGYVTNGRDYDFALVNSGTTAWQSFYLLAPAGASFVGGTTGNEASAVCAVGPPKEITCGPLSPTTVPPSARVSFVATTTAPAVCGPTFTLFVSTDGVTYVDAGELVPAPACGRQAPRALVRPSIDGVSKAGATVRVASVRWSAPSSRVTYHWERCAIGRCVAIAGVAGPSLRLTRADARHTIRVVVTATVAGQQVRVLSRDAFVGAG